jgi:hypothetical protein
MEDEQFAALINELDETYSPDNVGRGAELAEKYKDQQDAYLDAYRRSHPDAKDAINETIGKHKQPKDGTVPIEVIDNLDKRGDMTDDERFVTERRLSPENQRIIIQYDKNKPEQATINPEELSTMNEQERSMYVQETKKSMTEEPQVDRAKMTDEELSEYVKKSGDELVADFKKRRPDYKTPDEISAIEELKVRDKELYEARAKAKPIETVAYTRPVIGAPTPAGVKERPVFEYEKARFQAPDIDAIADELIEGDKLKDEVTTQFGVGFTEPIRAKKVQDSMRYLSSTEKVKLIVNLQDKGYFDTFGPESKGVIDELLRMAGGQVIPMVASLGLGPAAPFVAGALQSDTAKSQAFIQYVQKGKEEGFSDEEVFLKANKLSNASATFAALEGAIGVIPLFKGGSSFWGKVLSAGKDATTDAVAAGVFQYVENGMARKEDIPTEYLDGVAENASGEFIFSIVANLTGLPMAARRSFEASLKKNPNVSEDQLADISNELNTQEVDKNINDAVSAESVKYSEEGAEAKVEQEVSEAGLEPEKPDTEAVAAEEGDLSETSKKFLESEDEKSKTIREDIEKNRDAHTVRKLDDEVIKQRVNENSNEDIIGELEARADKVQDDPEGSAFVKTAFYTREKILNQIAALNLKPQTPEIEAEIAALREQEVRVFRASRVLNTSAAQNVEAAKLWDVTQPDIVVADMIEDIEGGPRVIPEGATPDEVAAIEKGRAGGRELSEDQVELLRGRAEENDTNRKAYDEAVRELNAKEEELTRDPIQESKDATPEQKKKLEEHHKQQEQEILPAIEKKIAAENAYLASKDRLTNAHMRLKVARWNSSYISMMKGALLGATTNVKNLASNAINAGSQLFDYYHAQAKFNRQQDGSIPVIGRMLNIKALVQTFDAFGRAIGAVNKARIKAWGHLGTNASDLQQMKAENAGRIHAIDRVAGNIARLFDAKSEKAENERIFLQDPNRKTWINKRDVAETISTVLGVAPDASFRALSWGDSFFRTIANEVELQRIADNRGLEGASRKAFLANPDQASIDMAENAARKTVFTQDSRITTLFSDTMVDFSKKLRKEADKAKTKVGKVALESIDVLASNLMPYTRVPTNLLITTTKLTIPVIPLAEAAVDNSKANTYNKAVKAKHTEIMKLFGESSFEGKTAKIDKAIKEYDELKAGYNKAIADYGTNMALAQQGAVLFASIVAGGFWQCFNIIDDDMSDEEKALRYSLGGKNAFNFSAARRLAAGGDPFPQEGDLTFNVAALGPLGMAGTGLALLGYHYNNNKLSNESMLDINATAVATGKIAKEYASQYAFIGGANVVSQLLTGRTTNSYLVSAIGPLRAPVPFIGQPKLYQEVFVRPFRDQVLNNRDIVGIREFKKSFREPYVQNPEDEYQGVHVDLWGQNVDYMPNSDNFWMAPMNFLKLGTEISIQEDTAEILRLSTATGTSPVKHMSKSVTLPARGENPSRKIYIAPSDWNEYNLVMLTELRQRLVEVRKGVRYENGSDEVKHAIISKLTKAMHEKYRKQMKADLMKREKNGEISFIEQGTGYIYE